MSDFERQFKLLTGDRAFPWQGELYKRFVAGDVPTPCNLPTGLGKTAIIVLWLLAHSNGAKLPRRLVYVMNRRTVVDQATTEAEKLRVNASRIGIHDLAISTLRGQFAGNREWLAHPSRLAVICGTVDMIGSRLLFSGYGVGFKDRPLHAAFLGQDALLVHDDAHLQPAFQALLGTIEREQQSGGQTPWPKLRVMELSSTSHGKSAFTLTKEDLADPLVKKRIKAKKKICLHSCNDKRKVAEQIAELARKQGDTGKAVLVFARTVEDVEKIAARLPKDAHKQLTGTLRGLELEGLLQHPVFQRFLPESNRDEKVEPAKGTVYLVCTSAGEVGANISADHMVCDLVTFDSMVQRFGRVNRFGASTDTCIDVVHPDRFDEGDGLELRRSKTVELLRRLDGKGSPAALEELDAEARLAAFAPAPVVLPATDILFDAWSLTTIRGRLPGRPPVERYLHGINSMEAPETLVAWREEVSVISGNLLERFAPEDLLDDYPLKPHELLRERSGRVFKHLQMLAKAHPEAGTWLVDPYGRVQVTTLRRLSSGDRDDIAQRIVLLAPYVGALTPTGALDCSAVTKRPRYGGVGVREPMKADSINARNLDVADEWYADKEGTARCRERIRSASPRPAPPDGMRLVRTIDTQPEADEIEGEKDVSRRFWHWYTMPRAADDDPSKLSILPVTWKQHTEDVAGNVERLVEALGLPPELRKALILSARIHDLGKRRDIWQRSIGNPHPASWHAKSGMPWKPRDICADYRHEFGSLLDALDPEQEHLTELENLEKPSPQMKDLVLHLIAAHHGYARPHFPPEKAYDRERDDKACIALAMEIPRRFARLQRKYGHWGLAYLESLLRAADRAVSANLHQHNLKP